MKKGNKKQRNFAALIKDSRGDIAYIESAVTLIVIMLCLALALNIFSLLVLRQDVACLCGSLAEKAAACGCTDEVDSYASALCESLGLDYGCLSYSFTGSDYIGSSSKIQYGDCICLSVSYQSGFGGTGIFNIPVTLTAGSTSLSEKYWKEADIR